MARERHVELQPDSIPVDAFRRSERQFLFNIDRIEKKYRNFELKHPCLEVEVTSGDIYVPVGLSSSEVRKEVDKFHAFEDQFGLGKLAACYNGDDVFGKQFKKRREECTRLDKEFAEVFKSENPSWRPYTTPKKSRVERTVIKKTVKELTFENSADYFNYLLKTNEVLSNAFRQQEKVGFVPRLSLPPCDLSIDKANVEPYIGSGIMTSRSCSPEGSTERSANLALGDLPPMLLSTDCTKSRECSPLRSLFPSDIPSVESDPSHPASTSILPLSSVRLPNESLREAQAEHGSQSLVETESCSALAEKLVSTMKIKSPDSTAALSSVTVSVASIEKRRRKRKLSPSRSTSGVEVNGQDMVSTPSHSKRILRLDAKGSCSSFDSTHSLSTKKLSNVEDVPSTSAPEDMAITDGMNIRNERLLTPPLPKESTKCKYLTLPAQSTSKNLRKRNTPHCLVNRGTEHSPSELRRDTICRSDSTPLCCRKRENCSPLEISLGSVPSSSRKKSPFELTPNAVPARRSSVEKDSGAQSTSRKFGGTSALKKETKRKSAVRYERNTSVRNFFGKGQASNCQKEVCDGKKRHREPTANRRFVSSNGVREVHTIKSTPDSTKSRNSRVKGAAVDTDNKVTSSTRKKSSKPSKSRHDRHTKKVPMSIESNDNGKNEKKTVSVSPPLSASTHSSPPGSCPYNTRSRSRQKRRSDDSDVERTVTPIQEEVASSLWNEDIQNVVKCYQDNIMNSGKIGTILGFDASEIRKQCDNSRRTVLSAVLNCAQKYQASDAASCVDTGLKEDRRAMAAAKRRNRQLTSGYYV
ncbi:hypothetical protein RB195_006712 [Necator americanus]|uniref:Uncharacterized protein n=1 Tax=Necator americanus TaxID=51031 RepID=A0ABR1BXP3_NECAM